jgi:hypothetical protein
MRTGILALAVAGLFAGAAAADIPPPKTKPTSTKPKLETGTAPLGGTTIIAGAALALAAATGGLFLIRRRQTA